MKKEYVSPVVTSLRYMFQEEVATTELDFDDPLINASSLIPPT